MGTPTQMKKFRINPVELVIFSTVLLMLVNSLYHLFYERPGLESAAWSALTTPVTASNAKASTEAPIFLSYDLKCESSAQTSTQAGKVRLNGMLCDSAGIVLGGHASATEGRSPASIDFGRVVRVDVTNQANQFNATVFTDASAGKFSTDYIPLNQGSNPVQVIFHAADGKRTTQLLNIDRH